MVGKSHLGARSPANLPINRGFDYHFGFLKGGEDHYNQGSGSKHGIPGTVDLWSGHALSNETGVYSGYLYATKAVDVIEKFASDTEAQVARGETPATGLFLYLAWHNTHTPLECPDEWMYPAYYNNSFKARMTYNCMSRILDDGVGNVTSALKKAGLWDDALLYFAADNGGWAGSSGASNFPLRGSKTSDYEGGIRAVSWLNGGKNILPENVRGGRHTGYISIADWYGTLLTMVGGSPDDHVPGLPPVDSNNFWPSILTPNATESGRDELWLAWSCVGDATKSVTGCGEVASIYNTTGDPTAGQNKDDMGAVTLTLD
jgi:arylsulfatase A-like enzyme